MEEGKGEYLHRTFSGITDTDEVTISRLYIGCQVEVYIVYIGCPVEVRMPMASSRFVPLRRLLGYVPAAVYVRESLPFSPVRSPRISVCPFG
jgi:hypothetical protein